MKGEWETREGVNQSSSEMRDFRSQLVRKEASRAAKNCYLTATRRIFLRGGTVCVKQGKERRNNCIGELGGIPRGGEEWVPLIRNQHKKGEGVP